MIPLFCEIEFDAVDNKEGIDNDKKMVGIPKGIESSKFLEGLW